MTNMRTARLKLSVNSYDISYFIFPLLYKVAMVVLHKHSV